MPPELALGTPIVVDVEALKRDPATPIDLVRRVAAPADAIVVRNGDGVAGLIRALVRRGSRK